jgi:hypothetical protein
MPFLDPQFATRRRLMLGHVFAFACVLAATGCASVGATSGNGVSTTAVVVGTAPPLSGDQLLVADRLLFGRNIPTGGQVSDSAWNAFMRDVITPVFPTGLTLLRSEGQWLDPRGVLVKEPGMIVEVLHPVGQPADSVFEQIANEYRRRFHQDAALRETWQVRARLYEAPVSGG